MLIQLRAGIPLLLVGAVALAASGSASLAQRTPLAALAESLRQDAKSALNDGEPVQLVRANRRYSGRIMERYAGQHRGKDTAKSDRSRSEDHKRQAQAGHDDVPRSRKPSPSHDKADKPEKPDRPGKPHCPATVAARKRPAPLHSQTRRRAGHSRRSATAQRAGSGHPRPCRAITRRRRRAATRRPRWRRHSAPRRRHALAGPSSGRPGRPAGSAAAPPRCGLQPPKWHR